MAFCASPQVVDLVVDAQAIGAGRVAGIVPAAGQAVVVGAPDIAGDAVTDDKAILPGDAVDAGEHVVKIRRRRFGGTRLLADKGGGDIGNDGAFRQTAPLDRGHRVGNKIQLMAAGEGVAHLLRVGQHEGALAQGMEMQGVAALGVPVKPHGRQEITEALHHQKLLGTLASVKGRPHLVITALVECELVTAPPCAKELPEKPEYLFRLTLGLHQTSRRCQGISNWRQTA